MSDAVDRYIEELDQLRYKAGVYPNAKGFYAGVTAAERACFRDGWTPHRLTQEVNRRRIADSRETQSL